MAVYTTTNMNGTIGPNTGAATIVTLPGPHSIIEVAIVGTGNARIQKNATAATDLNATTNSFIVGDSGYRLVLPEQGGPSGGPLNTVGIYADDGSGSGLTYAINLIKAGKS